MVGNDSPHYRLQPADDKTADRVIAVMDLLGPMAGDKYLTSTLLYIIMAKMRLSEVPYETAAKWMTGQAEKFLKKAE